MCSVRDEDNGRTPAIAFGSGVRGGGAGTGPARVLVFLQALHPHQVPAVSVAVYPTV